MSANYVCSQCLSVAYCSDECAEKDWPNHYPDCVGIGIKRERAGSNEKREYVCGLLFMAHDGIKLVKVWQNWIRHLTKNDITVCVGLYCEQQPPATDFEKSIWIENVREKTGWCDMGTVRAMCASYREMFRMFPQMQHVFVVSGRDLPIGTHELVKQVIDTSTSMFGLTGNLDIYDATDGQWKSYDYPETQEELQTVVQGNWSRVLEGHSTFIHLTARDARHLSNFSDWPSLPNVPKEVACPEEWAPLHILRRAFGADYAFENNQLTDMEWPPARGIFKRPLTWTSFDQVQEITVPMKTFFGEAMIPVETSLNEILEANLRGEEGFLFFRKVEGTSGASEYLKEHLEFLKD